MSDKKNSATEQADGTNQITTGAGEVTVPFDQPRSALTGAFVSNAVPRESNYQLWLKQHYDMAYSLGLEQGTAGESTQGDGLTLNPTTRKIAINHDASLKFDPTGKTGVNINPAGGVDPDISAEVKLKLHNSGGLKQDGADGVKLNLHTGGTGNNRYAGAIKSINDSGIVINVGTGTQRRGLTGYASGNAEGVALGIDIDSTLKFDTSGKLGINALSMIPKGIITMFSGSAAPGGWAFCNGQHGTPDLRDRFIKGSQNFTSSTGGSAQQSVTPAGTVTVQSHTLTVAQIPAHTHVFNSDIPNYYSGEIYVARLTKGAPLSSRSNVEETGGGQGHSHNATFTGTTKSITIDPPYYALAFIMKL